MKAKQWRILISLVFVACTIIVAQRYRRYVSAVFWRFGHDGLASIGEHKMQFPLLWSIAPSTSYGTIMLKRANDGRLLDQPQLVMSPLAAGQAGRTGAEVLRNKQRVADSLADRASLGPVPALVSIHAKALTFECIRTDLGPFAQNLVCNASGVPFTFSYDGPPQFEPEAESIIRSVE